MMKVRKYIEPDINKWKEDKDMIDSSTLLQPINFTGKLERVGMKESQL